MVSETLQQNVEKIVKAAFGLEAAIEHVEEIRTSEHNMTIDVCLQQPIGRYFIKIENAVLKPSTRQGQIEREVAGLQLARQAGIPCPVVMHYDTSGQIINRKYMVAEFVPGDLLWELKEAFTDSDRDRLKHEMAELLEQMNTITSPLFGDPYPGGPVGQHSAWKDAYAAMAQLLLRDSQALEIFQPEEYALVEEVLAANKNRLASNHPAGLVHGDLGIHNVIAARRGGELHIGSVIDFGNAMFGPIYLNEDGVRLHGGWGLEPIDVCEKYGISREEYEADCLLFGFERAVFLSNLFKTHGWGDPRQPVNEFLADCKKAL